MWIEISERVWRQKWLTGEGDGNKLKMKKVEVFPEGMSAKATRARNKTPNAMVLQKT
ncbi:hypothetical protein [Paenibacillus sp. FSL L8-0463]|uniref:hypothetical protein n=1 Tax=Paenibacillus sp. FSL L8-0463 TaxID=2954687 RepID=UPI003119C84B